MFEYQKTNRYFAQIASGLEELGAAEVKELGGENVVPAHRGIYFEGDAATLYRANYQSRVLTRVLAPLVKFQCHNEKYLYRKMKEIEWDQFFSLKNTFAIFANVSNSKITHSQYAALVAKDAIVDYFREKTGDRPNVERLNPDVWISVHIEKNFATISWDTSGGSLHRRGYRKFSVEAPMQETVAAAIVRLSEWDGKQKFYDPFCGSGTLLAEALMVAAKIPAGFLREKFGFQFLPDFDADLWQQVKKKADGQVSEIPPDLIVGSDISADAAEGAKSNLSLLPFGNQVKIQAIDFEKIQTLEQTTIVANPPHGIRLGKKEEIKKLYQKFGNFLKHRCVTSTAFIYFGDRTLIQFIGLKPSWRKPLRNGGQDGRLAKFEIFAHHFKK
ncbi:MAG: class I SAM-dependent RNA methyltransferase [Calditrichaeota bacterium]|nr:class I SAM-dependent RNA methyltransferase [Calditrichota bacterium]